MEVHVLWGASSGLLEGRDRLGYPRFLCPYTFKREPLRFNEYSMKDESMTNLTSGVCCKAFFREGPDITRPPIESETMVVSTFL